MHEVVVARVWRRVSVRRARNAGKLMQINEQLAPGVACSTWISYAGVHNRARALKPEGSQGCGQGRAVQLLNIWMTVVTTG